MRGIYIHVPFCKSKCSYCDFVSYPKQIEKAEAYFACLYKEIRLRGELYKGKKFDTLYFGGGTPSFVKPEYILGCVRQVKKYFDLDENAEITLELNPGTIDKAKIETYKKAGINRFSVGLQSARDDVLADIGRVHTARDFARAVKLLEGENFSVDVMIGLPNESTADVLKTADVAVKSGASHISAYALKAEEGTPMYSRYLSGELCGEDEIADSYDALRAFLKEKGFTRYEVSNFCRDGKYSRHNLNYWKRGEYIGLGVASSSFMDGRRFTNTSDIDDYVRCILVNRYPEIFSETIEGEEARGEFMMLALRTAMGAKDEDYKAAFDRELREDYKDAIRKNTSYLDITDEGIAIKDEYLYVQNTIIVDFLR